MNRKVKNTGTLSFALDNFPPSFRDTELMLVACSQFLWIVNSSVPCTNIYNTLDFQKQFFVFFFFANTEWRSLEHFCSRLSVEQWASSTQSLGREKEQALVEKFGGCLICLPLASPRVKDLPERIGRGLDLGLFDLEWCSSQSCSMQASVVARKSDLEKLPRSWKIEGQSLFIQI